MNTHNMLYLILITLSTFLFSHGFSELCHPQDKKVLLQIRKAFKNPKSLAAWDPKTDCCQWHSVNCNETTHRVTYLFISDGNLVGPIPPQIGDLPYLETLGLYMNPNLTGTIPVSITKLKRLTHVFIHANGISGPIPDFLAQMKSLELILLSNNALTGPIPSNIATLPNLNHFQVDNNKLTGTIPDTFGDFKGKDFWLELYNNELTGKIPVSLGKKKDFNTINLSGNRLKGDASMLFGRPTSTINLSRNSLNFDLSKVRFQKELTHLDLSHNKIFGSLPPEMAKVFFHTFNVSYNRLCGKIPDGGELHTRFGPEAFFHNRCLCGAPLPACK